MAEHNDLGKKGEDIAFDYLIRKGYKIIARNWRFRNEELDLVAVENNELVIVEVKTRSAAVYESPQDSITLKKIRHIVEATEAYIEEFDVDMETRFDVVSIKWFGEGKYELEHIVDAFGPPVN